MDIIADYANLTRLGREAALEETIPWMLHCLHRRAVAEALRALTTASGTHAATAVTMGCEGGRAALRGFYNQQEAIIRYDPSDSSAESSASAAEVEFFEKIQRQVATNFPS